MRQTDKDLLVGLWLSDLFDAAHREKVVKIAFAYFELLTSLRDKHLDEDYRVTCEPALAQQLELAASYFSTGRAGDADKGTYGVTMDEQEAFDIYFASVELVLRRRLQRVYFPIPRDCRDQVTNPVVRDQIEEMQLGLVRDSAESKVVDFVERARLIARVIGTQQFIFTKSSFGFLFRFLVSNSALWVLLTFGLTLFINVNLLIYSSDSYDRDTEYLPPHILRRVYIAGYAHVATSGIFLVNYMLGLGGVNLQKRFEWLQSIASGLTVLELFESRAPTQVFVIVMEYIPAWAWALIFLVTDPMFLYYGMFLLFSLLGLLYDVAFFAFHVIDVAQRIKLLGYVMRSVVINGDQVLVTLLLGATLMWMYSVFAVYVYGFGQYGLGYGGEYGWSNTLVNQYLQHLDYGLRNSPEFADYNDPSVTKYLFDISYNVSDCVH